MNLGSAFRNIALEIYIKSHTVVQSALLYYFVLIYLLDLPTLRQLCWFTLAFCIFAHKKGAICQRESSFVISAWAEECMESKWLRPKNSEEASVDHEIEPISERSLASQHFEIIEEEENTSNLCKIINELNYTQKCTKTVTSICLECCI